MPPCVDSGGVGVLSHFVNPSVAETAGTALAVTSWQTTDRGVDLNSECLLSRNSVSKPSYMCKDSLLMKAISAVRPVRGRTSTLLTWPNQRTPNICLSCGGLQASSHLMTLQSRAIRRTQLVLDRGRQWCVCPSRHSAVPIWQMRSMLIQRFRSAQPQQYPLEDGGLPR